MFNKYIINDNIFLKINNVEKVNNDVFLDTNGNVINFGKLSTERAYTMYDLKKDIKEVNETNYKQLAKKYGMHVMYSDDEEQRVYLAHFDSWNDFDFIIDIAEQCFYDISSHSENVLQEHYFVHNDISTYLLEDYDLEPHKTVKILNVDSEIQPYKYYKNINISAYNDILIVGKYYGLTFKKNVVFVTKDDYNKIAGKNKEYYAIKSGTDYEIFKENGIEYVDYEMFHNVDVYTSKYDISDKYSRIINNLYIYDDYTLYEINHKTKTIDLSIENCEILENNKYVFIVGKDVVKRIELF